MADTKPGSFGIYFKAPGSSAMRIPVNPQNISVTYPTEHTAYNVTNIGEIVIPRLPKLATVEFESFFPRMTGQTGGAQASGDVFNALIIANDLLSPEGYVSIFTRWMDSKTIIDFTINRFDGDQPMFDTAFKAVITDFKITDNGGESGDIYYTIALSEYREAKPSKLETKSTSVDSDGNVSKEVVAMIQRPSPPQMILVGDQVEVSGKVYGEPDEINEVWKKTRAIASKVYGKVVRVLPPEVQRTAHGVYVEGVGWVDRASCIKQTVGNPDGAFNTATDIAWRMRG